MLHFISGSYIKFKLGYKFFRIIKAICKEREMIRMIKLIAADMDSTLLDDNGNLNEEFDSVFHQLVKKDIKFAVASGRQYYRLKASFKDHWEDMLFIADNGSMLVDGDEKLYSKALEDRDVKGLIRDSKEFEESHIVLSGKEKAYLDSDEEELIEEIEKYYKRYEVVENLEKVEDEILKVAIFFPGDAEERFGEFFQPRWKDRVKIALSSPIWIDIYNKGTDKGVAMRIIQEKFGIKREETMAFGDYFNDVELLEEAKHSYAMENAHEDFKKHANFIAASNNENGVLEVIKREVL